jgi:hypothetical protein
MLLHTGKHREYLVQKQKDHFILKRHLMKELVTINFVAVALVNAANLAVMLVLHVVENAPLVAFV